MKSIQMVVEIDLGLVQDDFEVTQKNCQETIETCELVNTSYTTLQITSKDIDSGLITNLINAGEAE